MAVLAKIPTVLKKVSILLMPIIIWANPNSTMAFFGF